LECQQSLTLHLIDQHEWFVWLEVDWRFWLVSVDNIPLLVQSIVAAPYNNILVVSILSSSDIKNLSFLVDYVSILEIEQLPPSSIGSFNIKLVISSLVWNAD